ncbi:response regulator [Nostoc sp. UHCC 0702]|nr:response regulator [Nostoc sp. UHCC 0702]
MNILSQTQTTKTIKILIVEDEFILAVNLQESLESLGYSSIEIVDTAEGAIEKATELRPNLILMDIRLRGDMDGIQAAEQIWNRLQIPIIYVTGHSDKSTVERATLTSPFGYILKPVREQELYVAIQTTLTRYEREQFLSSVLRGMGDGVIVIDPQLRIKFLNPAAEALTGWRHDEAKNRMLDQVMKLVDEQTLLPANNPLISALVQQTTVYLGNRVLLINRNGTTIPVADSATPLRNHDGEITGAVMVFRDDTQRRLIEERNLAAEHAQQLEIQMAELQRLNQLKEDFLRATSHEMRTPLSNIKMAITVLETILNQQSILPPEPPDASSSVSLYLNILRNECERELDLVDDLLNMRFIDAGVYPLELTAIHLQFWLPHITESFQQRLEARRQTLEVSVDLDLPPIVTDLAILTRVISELLNNACKYTPSGEQITVIAKLASTTNSQIDVSPDAQTSRVQITISNSGVEIPIKEQTRIFDLFYRIPESTIKEQNLILELFDEIAIGKPGQSNSVGLGLALVKKLVQYLQGAIALSSSQGWTRFTVELPLTLVDIDH